MPFYSFINPETQEVKDIFQQMLDEHVYEEGGVKWNRLWNYAPAASVDSSLDANDPKSYLKYTNKRKGSLGDLMDLSGELSEKRAGITKQDEVKNKWLDDYSARRKGHRHHSDVRKNSNSRLKKFGIEIEN